MYPLSIKLMPSLKKIQLLRFLLNNTWDLPITVTKIINIVICFILTLYTNVKEISYKLELPVCICNYSDILN